MNMHLLQGNLIYDVIVLAQEVIYSIYDKIKFGSKLM